MAKTAIASINNGNVNSCNTKVVSDDNGINIELELYGIDGTAYNGDAVITVVVY